ASVVDINTTMEDNTQLGNSSSLHEGQRLAKGKRYHGSPAEETEADYCAIARRRCGSLRRGIYSLVMLVLAFVSIPAPVLVVYSWWPELYQYFVGAAFPYDAPWDALWSLSGKILVASLAAFFGFVGLGVLSIGIVPRVLNLLLTE